jgi:chorismate dehydratase
LARIVLAHRHNVRPEFCDLSRASDAPDEARLLIGDKVVTAEPKAFRFQLDLGEEWKAMTGLPFVFATWMAGRGVDLTPLHACLLRAKQRGLANIDAIVARHAVPLGWPEDLARQYLTKNLRFDVGPREIQAIEQFHALAAREGLIAPPAPLRVFR